MTIGQFYNANNVVVGQAAVLVAPQNTSLPDFSTLSLSDPFNIAPWTASSVKVSASSSYTLSVGGQSTSALTDTSTTAQIASALGSLSSVGGVGNVIVTGTPTSYQIVFAEGVPASTQAVTSSATSGSAAVTGGNWVPVGATTQGWKFGASKNTQAINIEEQSTAVGQSITSQSVTFDGVLSEDISSTLALAYNGTLTRNAATSSQPGYDEINPTDNILYYSVAMITTTEKGFPRLVYAPKCSQLSNVETTFRRAAAQREYPVNFTTLCQPSQIRVISLTSAHN